MRRELSPGRYTKQMLASVPSVWPLRARQGTTVNKRKVAAVLLVLSLLVVRSSAAQTPPMGAGTQSCGQWVSTRASTDELDIIGEGMMTAWVQGFLSGIWMFERAAGRASFLLPNAAAVQGWLDTRCKDRPVEQLVVSATILITELTTGTKRSE
jgi:hypothetical protein